MDETIHLSPTTTTSIISTKDSPSCNIELSQEKIEEYDTIQTIPCETSVSSTSPSSSLSSTTVSIPSPLETSKLKSISTSLTSVSNVITSSPSSLFSPINSSKRARFELNQIDNEINNNDNNSKKTILSNQFPCPCGQMISNSSAFLEHIRQCHEFIQTASNFAEVMAMNAAIAMSSEWNRCYHQAVSPDNFSINSIHSNTNNNTMSKNNNNSKGNSSVFYSALDLSFHRSNEIPSLSSSSSPPTLKVSPSSFNKNHFSSNITCPQCSFTSTDISMLCKHFELNHDKSGKFTCTKCHETYDHLIYYLKHQLFQHCLNLSDTFDQLSTSTLITNIPGNSSTLSSMKTIMTSNNSDDILSSSDGNHFYLTQNHHDDDTDEQNHSQHPLHHQIQVEQNIHCQRYNNLKQYNNHSRNYSPTPLSPSRVQSSNNDQNYDVYLSDKKLTCNACHQSGFSHTGELISHLTGCPRFMSVTGIINCSRGSGTPTLGYGSSNITPVATTTTTTTNDSNHNIDSLNLRMNNELLNFTLLNSMMNSTQTTSTMNHHSTCISPLINELNNNSITFDFEKNFNDLLKSSRGSSISNHFSDNNQLASNRFTCSQTLTDTNDSTNYKSSNLYSSFPSRCINSQNSYTQFISNLHSIEKSYCSGITKSSSASLSPDDSTDLQMTKLTTSNTSVYNNSTTSVNSLLLNEFNTNRHINHHTQHHSHMKQLKLESQQHHQHTHQLQQNQSMINLPSTTTCIESITDLSRPFKCCHCIKAFKSKALLDQHMHIHYPPKYTCRYCAKKYRWPPVFYHHQRTCKKRPPSTTCTNNEIHNSTITVTTSTNTTHNNSSSSNSAKRNHHQHHNLNYLRSDIRKNFPITSDAFIIPSNIRSQLDDTLYSSFTSIRGSDGNLGGNETFPSYGHKSYLPSFSTDLNLPSNLMELSTNPTMVHNNNNTNSTDDLTLMTSSHLNNFTALAAAAAAAAMSMHFQMPSFSNIPPPPLGFTSSFTSSSTSTTITTSSPSTALFYHHSISTTSPSTSLTTSSSQIHLNCNRSNLLSFTNQPNFQSPHFVSPILMPNSNEPLNINESSLHSELNFPFNNILPTGTSILTPTTITTTSSTMGTINNHHLLDSSTLPYNIMNNLLCICGMRFNEISNYLSHIANCNFLRHLVQQSFSSAFNRSEIPPMPTTITTTSSSSIASSSSQILSENRQNSNRSSHIQQISSSSSIFPFNTSTLSNEFQYQDDFTLNNKYRNDVGHQEDIHADQQQLDTLKDSKIINTMISNRMYNSLNEIRLSKVRQDESIKHEETLHNEVSQHSSFMNETLHNNNEHFNKNPIDLTPVYNLTESQIERNKSPSNSSYHLENSSLSDKQISINSSNGSIVTAMANVLANAASVAGFQYPELQDLPYRNSKIQHFSPSQTPPLQMSTSPTVDIIETDPSDCHSQQNITNNSLDNTTPTTVNSPKSCYQCGKEFSSRLSLKQHVEGKHSTEGKYCCPGCSKRYRWGASYYYHKKSCPAVREQSPVPSDDAVNPLSLYGSDDNSSPSSVNSSNSLSRIKSNEDYNTEDRDTEEGEEEEEKDYNHDDGEDDNTRQKDEKKDECKCNSSNSLKVRIIQKQYLRSSKNGDLKANSMDDNVSPPMHQSKLIKHQIQTKQHCQNIKEDSLICDINAFPLETNS
ncbi:hypothetical protein MN116_005821 [Schistosoma mekongi]|uniref:C2H2-type domain-containing protein n=1 Tax=Schistosoma mekongi TaxID=38744 RepID=A0AAE1ZAN5_SCHME|nr:hypothetical protein MN116_005821 [Schistosoma mekongi]